MVPEWRQDERRVQLFTWGGVLIWVAIVVVLWAMFKQLLFVVLLVPGFWILVWALYQDLYFRPKYEDYQESSRSAYIRDIVQEKPAMRASSFVYGIAALLLGIGFSNFVSSLELDLGVGPFALSLAITVATIGCIMVVKALLDRTLGRGPK
jgi:hypothetical protein